MPAPKLDLILRALTGQVGSISPLDPLTYTGVSVGLLAAAAVASYIPAWRASVINPVDALRAE